MSEPPTPSPQDPKRRQLGLCEGQRFHPLYIVSASVLASTKYESCLLHVSQKGAVILSEVEAEGSLFGTYFRKNVDKSLNL